MGPSSQMMVQVMVPVNWALFLALFLWIVSCTAQSGIVPSSTPFDNPATLTKLINSIPNQPECTVRPQTVVEIQRMRESAQRIAFMIEREVEIMNKRKTFIEQMTAYLNDRIRELNRVKSELSEETRWIEVSTNRIEELAQREKLIKLQDVLACLNADQNQLTGQASVTTDAVKNLNDQAKSISDKITEIKKSIEAASKGTPGGGGSSGAAAPAAS